MTKEELLKAIPKLKWDKVDDVEKMHIANGELIEYRVIKDPDSGETFCFYNLRGGGFDINIPPTSTIVEAKQFCQWHYEGLLLKEFGYSVE